MKFVKNLKLLNSILSNFMKGDVSMVFILIVQVLLIALMLLAPI